MRGVVAGNGRRRDVEQDDQQSEPGPGREAQRELPRAEGYTACDKADKDAAERAGAGVKGPDACRQADEERQRKNSKGEQQPAEEAMARRTSSGPRTVMVAVSVRSTSDGRAFHHHHGAAYI
ncbi:hypothetical protein [Methylocystis sp. JR02]|uniref:hypothetical protein n=1 Tax=Methylocystis sp. JR02 TaxID=3046284 RepID=UPI0032D97817